MTECKGCGVEYEDREDFVKNPNPYASGKVCPDCYEDVMLSLPPSPKEIEAIYQPYLKESIKIKGGKVGVGFYNSDDDGIMHLLCNDNGSWIATCPLEKIGRFATLQIRLFNDDIINDEIKAYLNRQGYLK